MSKPIKDERLWTDGDYEIYSSGWDDGFAEAMEANLPQVCPGSGYAAEWFGSPLGTGVCGICKQTVGVAASGLCNTHPYVTPT